MKIIKKSLSALLALVMLLSITAGVDLSAYAATSGDYTYEVLDDGTVEITGYTGTASSISIPGTIGGKKVTSIGEGAFWACESLASVTIPNSVTSIGKDAFVNCTSLTSVTLPNSVTSIGKDAFLGCHSLSSVTIPNSVTSIGEGAFFGCDSLTSVTIPNSVTSIGDQAFLGCHSLSSVTIPNSVTSIGEGAFWACESLSSVTIPNSVTSIGKDAFFGCHSLSSVNVDASNKNYASVNGVLYNKNKTELIRYPEGKTASSFIIPNSVTSISEKAFDDCENLTSVTIPNSVTSIGDKAFFGCENLTSVTIPNSVTSIGKDTFGFCTSLTSVTIPNSVTSIGDEAFENCTSLTSVTIPNSVTSIGKSVFSRCEDLTSINVNTANRIYTSVNGVLYNKNKTEIVCYPAGKTASSFIIPNSVTSIGAYVFYYCENLTSVTIPNSVTNIGDYAFENCTSLTSVTIPNSVTNIGDYAFWGCDSLTSITIPNSIISIGANAFEWTGYYNNESNWTDGVLYIGNCLMNADPNVVPDSYAIKDGTTVIANHAFYDCENLTSVTMPKSVTGIGETAFLHVNVNFVLNCYYGSYAYQYALENDIKYKFISNEGMEKFNTNETKTVTISSDKDKKYFVFTPSVSGKYDVDYKSEDLYVYILDSDMNYVDETIIVNENVRESYPGYYVDSYYALEKGKIYYLEISAGYFDSYPVSENITVGLRHEHRFSNGKCTVCGIAEYYYKVLSDGTAELTGYNGSEKNLTIPSVIDGYRITSIREWAFANCSSLTSVTIPNSVTSISNHAFYDCDSLTNINIDTANKNYASVNGVLYSKDKTELICYPDGKTASSFTIPNSVISISWYSFADCPNLTSVTIPNSVTRIEYWAFRFCTSLTSITVKNKNCKFGEAALGLYATIYGYKNSTAETYAKEHGNKFVAIDAECSHTWNNGKVTKAATCTANGVKTYTCTACGETKTETIKATGHSYDNGVITKQPTSTATGIKTYTCTKCKATKTETLPVTRLQTPTAKAVVNANGGFTISWNKITGADKYDVYYDNGTGYKLLRTVTGTSTTTGTAPYGKKYSYKVRAVNNKNSAVTSAFSAAVTAINNKKLQTPTLKATVNANGSFKLSWNKVEGATRYGIYMLENGKYKWIKSTSATSWTTGTAQYGKKYTYKVFAVNDNTSAKSEFSSAVSATNNKKLQATTAKVTVNANGSFKLSWNKVTGATKYGIYMKQANGSYKWIKTVTGTSFTTAVAAYGKQYSYKVLAANNNKSAQTFSNVVNAKNTKKLQTPTLKVAVNKNGSFKLSWGKVTGATSYQIYMKQSNGTYKLIKTTSSTSFTTAVAAKGKTYSYKVRAVTSKNKNATSNYSNVVSVKRK